MKKKGLVKFVKNYVEEQGVDNINRDNLALALMQEGAGLSLVGRELTKALKAAGVETITRTPSESREKLVAHLGTVSIGWSTYREMRLFVEDLAEQFEDISEKAILATVKAELKNADLPIPTKPTLGDVKAGIIDYFNSTKDHSLKGMASYLEENVTVKEEPMSADKALHTARMQYSFSKYLWDNVDLADLM